MVNVDPDCQQIVRNRMLDLFIDLIAILIWFDDLYERGARACHHLDLGLFSHAVP